MFANQFDFVIFIFSFAKSLGSFTLLRVIFSTMVIGLASATSQLDRNAWQRVAPYKSGSKQTWRRIFCSYSQVFLGFFLQIPCYILSSCATSFADPYRRSVVPVQNWCLEENPSRPSISFPWAVLCVVDFLSLILVGHSTGETDETMKRREVHHTSTSNDFHAALFVDEYPHPLIDVCTIGNSPILHTNLDEPPLSVQL